MASGIDQKKVVATAVAVITTDFSVWYCVESLAKKVHKTELELQAVFKAVHGKTVMKYARVLRMQHAHELLEKYDYPLRVVCEMVGYPDPANFSVAFLRVFGYRPGEVMRQKKMITDATCL